MHTDGDGTIELPNFQAAHERIFKAVDSTKIAGLRWRRCERSCTGPSDRFCGVLNAFGFWE